MQGLSPIKQHQRARWPLTDDMALSVPVVQATLGTCDGPRLVGAVSRAGALGCLTYQYGSTAQFARRLKQIRAITPRPHLVAFTPQWQRDEILETCLAHHVRAFQVFWWNGPRLAPRIRNAGAHVFWQVGSVEEAEDALEAGANVLVAQGTQAGGQVRGPHSLPTLVRELRSRYPDVPLVAGGGLATRQDVQAVLSWGANAALMGTRFLLTEEARAPSLYKARLLCALSEHLTLDNGLAGDWPCAPRRYLPTRHGDHAAFFAGAGLSRMRRVLPANEVVRQLSPL